MRAKRTTRGTARATAAGGAGTAGWLLLSTVLLAGCTVPAPSDASDAADAADAADTSDAAPPPAVEVATAAVHRPEVQQGADEFTAVGPVRGHHHLGAVPLVAGASWLAVNCRSDGPRQAVTVEVEQVTEVGVTCEREETTSFLTRLDLTAEEAGSAQLTVHGPEGVEWYVAFQLPDGAVD
ncbi:hypothetical protein [Streptomyces bohaiensis]|uniref:Lipoprotein n=1 Tax=Streptomyces bohaiensis TaxID=1431344 RepID=A0ABX1CAK7_9ACTN|nr:hypothetical protein [Streptomyces bohaiensis]NJQ14953.1 hypothetical protein [Streptomyces bohaiensis]